MGKRATRSSTKRKGRRSREQWATFKTRTMCSNSSQWGLMTFTPEHLKQLAGHIWASLPYYLMWKLMCSWLYDSTYIVGKNSSMKHTATIYGIKPLILLAQYCQFCLATTDQDFKLNVFTSLATWKPLNGNTRDLRWDLLYAKHMIDHWAMALLLLRCLLKHAHCFMSMMSKLLLPIQTSNGSTLKKTGLLLGDSIYLSISQLHHGEGIQVGAEKSRQRERGKHSSGAASAFLLQIICSQRCLSFKKRLGKCLEARCCCTFCPPPPPSASQPDWPSAPTRDETAWRGQTMTGRWR